MDKGAVGAEDYKNCKSHESCCENLRNGCLNRTGTGHANTEGGKFYEGPTPRQRILGNK